MSKTPSFRIEESLEQRGIILEGSWDFRVKKPLLKALQKALENGRVDFIDFHNEARIDFAFGAFFNQQIKRLSLMPRISAQEKISEILALCDYKKPKQEPKILQFKGFFESLNDFGKEFFRSLIDFINFVGMSFYYLFFAFRGRNTIRFKSFLFHINESGFKALPVSLLASFIVGFTITLQGAVQLEYFEAPLMAVEMGAKLSLREIGPFVLALVIAGRSASSFTAQIGVMQITEEINAMKTMDFNPIYFLVIPRLLALVFILPSLVFLADIFSLIGGAMATYLHLGMDFSIFIDRLYETVDWTHFWVGIIKAPFFGAVIALVGCFRGFCVKGDTQDLGHLTTVSVVNALFWMITVDAIFSFITVRMGV